MIDILNDILGRSYNPGVVIGDMAGVIPDSAFNSLVLLDWGYILSAVLFIVCLVAFIRGFWKVIAGLLP